jgi:hypothetical protein
MSEFANPASGQDELNRPPSILDYSWNLPGGGASISMPVTVAERIKQQVMDAFCALPKRGLEVGGVLFGRVAGREPLEIVVDAFEPIPCEHRFGPSFILSDDDHVQLRQILAGPRPASSVVGYYRSFTGREIELDETDQELIENRFSGPEQVVLAIKPISFTQCVAWCFTRQNSHLPLKPTGSPLVFAEGPSTKNSHQPEPSAPGVLESDSEPGAADLPEPGPAPPAWVPTLSPSLPQRGHEPEPLVRRRLFPWALAAVLGLAALAFLFRPWDDASGTQQWASVGLAAQPAESGIQVTWDRSLPALQQATGGLLAIHDGSSERQIKLDAQQVARGRLMYKPSGSDLLFRLSIFGPGKQPATESFRMAGARPCPSPAENRVATGTAARISPQVPLPPDRRSLARLEKEPGTPRPPSHRGVPRAAVAAEVIHEVRPGISEAIEARLRSPVVVPINVQIDASGKVGSAVAPGDGDGVYRYLAKRAKQAARFWRFRPARGTNGEPVPSTKTLFFVFRG